MTKTISSLKLFLFVLLSIITTYGFISLLNSPPVTEVNATVCGSTNWVTKSGDYSGQGVNINFSDVGYGHKRKISVSAQSGYTINEVWLDVDNDNHSGFYQYASGPLNNFNPNPGDEIYEAKVKVKFNCPATPTPTVTPVPTQVPQCKSENAECYWNHSQHDCCPGLSCDFWRMNNGHAKYKCQTSDPTPTHGCPTRTPTITQTPTPTIIEEVESTPTPTSIIEPETTPTETPLITNTPAPTNAPANNDNNGGNNNQNNSNPGPPVCTDADPGAPTNLTAVALGGGKVKLTWNDAPGPHTSYAVAYGPSVGNYLYGDPNVGNVTSYTVLALNPGGNYCFYVQAQNGCKGGVPSNVVCTNQGVGSVRVLGTTDNYNPLVIGIKESYGGEVLGEATELAGTAEVLFSQTKLPSGNSQDFGHKIVIPKINVDETVYLPQAIGDQLTVGHREVLYTRINGVNLYYGHNATDVFGRLFQLKAGDRFSINQDNQIRQYQIDIINFVYKDKVEALTVSNPDQVLLMTCSYTQPDYRIIVKASLIN